MSHITDINQFKREIRRCRELAIRRKLGYTHHVFVGEVDDDGCDLYHYAFALQPLWKFNSPCKITKIRLNYDRYETCKEIHKIFNFDNGDVVIIVNRDDYPNDKESEEVCIKKANSRLGEEMYSASENNCQSFVNKIFSNDNTSEQIKSSTSKQIAGDAVDGLVSTGILHPATHSASGAIHYSQSSKTGKESMNSIESPEEKTTNKMKGDTKLSAFQENTKKTNAKTMSNKIENTLPRSFNDICQAEQMKEDTQYFHSHKSKAEYKEDKSNKFKDETQSQIMREESKKPPQPKKQIEIENMRPHKAQELIGKAEEHFPTQKGELMRNMKEDRNNMEQIQVNEQMNNRLSQKSEINLTNTQHSYSGSNGLELNNLGVIRSLATSTDCSFIPKQVAKKAQKAGIKNVSQSLSTAAVCFSVGVEAVSLTYSLYKIHTNKSTTEDQKIRGTVKEVCSSVCGVGGSVIGQVLIPIPVVGCLIGGAFGNMYGSAIGGLFYPP